MYATASDPATLACDLVAAAGGLFLLPGLFTPLVATLMAIDQLWAGFSQSLPIRSEAWVHFLFAGLSLSLAMLGPGAWSIDARRFGRKVFDIAQRERDTDYTL